MNGRNFYAVFAFIIVLFSLTASSTITKAQKIDIKTPAGSGQFGKGIVALPNGNIVITDPNHNAPGQIKNVGAVYLYNGSNGMLISTLTGNTENNLVGSGGVTVLANGNYVVSSPSWDNGAVVDVGAVTWCDGAMGCSGIVSPDNSLVGSTANDYLGFKITALTNGNYVINSPFWDSAEQNVGAVTFSNGASGISGTVSSANSLVGSTAGDQVGYHEVIALNNGNYVVSSRFWSGTASKAGAATFGNGMIGISGIVSESNSLVGSTDNNFVGSGDIFELANGNYVVSSPGWDRTVFNDNAGAVTFGDGINGVSGRISEANSLVGSSPGDLVGARITVLTNGNYVVSSSQWDNGAIVNVGAATFGNGTSGVAGIVSASNSLIGSNYNDLVAAKGVTALANGNYVVRSPLWDRGFVSDTGVATFGNGAIGITGTISESNSLVGFWAYDKVGDGEVISLTNGNYVVPVPDWHSSYFGAITFGNGTTGISGKVSESNSLIGSTPGDRVGSKGVVALANGNYVICSPDWNSETAADVGAATLGNGTTGISGTISASNSLIGSTAYDRVSHNGVTALKNGNYVVGSSLWRNGASEAAGAVTFGSGTIGITGIVSASNSLIGSTNYDYAGSGGVVVLISGNYVVSSFEWDGMFKNVGAVTIGNGETGVSGTISDSNSFVGSSKDDYFGSGGITALRNGNYVVKSPYWDNGEIPNAGAISYLRDFTGSNLSSKADFYQSEKFMSDKTFVENDLNSIESNSIFGMTKSAGSNLNFTFDDVNNQLIVGRPYDNAVTFFRLDRTATATVSGKVSDGKRGIGNAVVRITDGNGKVKTTRTNSFGMYKFEGVIAEQSYTIAVSARRYSFVPQIVFINGKMMNLDFTAQ